MTTLDQLVASIGFSDHVSALLAITLLVVGFRVLYMGVINVLRAVGWIVRFDKVQGPNGVMLVNPYARYRD